MAQVESLKCPNCGAAIKGSGDITCRYCGSQLHITGDKASGTQNVMLLIPGRGQTHEGVTAYFKNLPGTPITTETTSVPFQPVIDYSLLPGGKIDPHFEGEPQAIAEVCRRMQQAMNEEDLDLYQTLVSKANPDFYETALQGARETFVINDAKRYTTKISFIDVNRESAIVDVSNETISFPEGGAVQNVEMTFRYSMKKEPDGWKIVVSALSMPGGKSSGRFWFIFILATTLITPIIIGVVLMLNSPGCSGEEETPVGYEDTSGQSQYIFTDNESAVTPGDTCEVGMMPLIIWSAPSVNSTPLGSISGPEKVKVLAIADDNWVQIQRSNGETCWTQAYFTDGVINGLYDDMMDKK